MSAGRKIVSKL